MKGTFSKYSGCGNDFILIDNRTLFFPVYDPLCIQKLCRRQLGVGADGIVLLENGKIADYKMRIFNADGSEAEMCGNGIRCLLKFMRQKGLKKKSYAIECMDRIYSIAWDGEDVAVQMPPPSDMQWDIDLSLETHMPPLHFLDTGVPHAVFFLENEKILSAFPVQTAGPAIRRHPRFSPKGTNVNFAAFIGAQELAIRTYERGVEQETLACGTGAVASALAAAQKFDLSSPIFLKTASSEKLTVSFAKENGAFSNVQLKGPAHFIYSGKLDLSIFCKKS